MRSPVRGPHNLLWNVIGARTLSTTGQQLFLIDGFRDTGRPLLSVMADPKSIFARALSAFKARTLYSNIINDRSAVYYTTCITATDPFVDLSKVDVNYLPATRPSSSTPPTPSARGSRSRRGRRARSRRRRGRR